MSLVLTVVLCLVLNVPASQLALIKHAARLDTRQWRLMAGQTEAQDRKPGEERGADGAFESDMRLTSQQMADILQQQQAGQRASGEGVIPSSRTGRKRRGRFRRKAVAHESYLWPGRTVPYKFHHSLPEYYKDTILEAMEFWQRSTCIKFVPFSDSMIEYLRHMDYVLFSVGDGCQSSIGRVGIGQQSTEIASHCNEFGSVAHEIGHVLGFYHEQSRPDRDNYVTILRQNIRPGRQHNFLKYSKFEIVTKEPYDIGSVMHYGPTYFSKDGGSRTIETQDETYRAVMGQRNAPSFIDVKSANDMYRCNERCAKWPKCANMGYVGPDCTCMCPTGLGGRDCRDVKASTADCGGVLKHSTGAIESPGYGYAYDNNVDCLWLIQGPRGTRSISLRTEWFELEDDAVQPCAFDWLEVRTLGPHLNGQRFCGEGPSGDIVYHGDALVLHFHSDDSYTFGGFKLRYVIHDDVTRDVRSKLQPLFSDYTAEDIGLDYDGEYTPRPQERPHEPATDSAEAPTIETRVTAILPPLTARHSDPQTWTAIAFDSTTQDPLRTSSPPPPPPPPETARGTDGDYDNNYDSYYYHNYEDDGDKNDNNNNADDNGLMTAWSEWSPCSGPRCDVGARWRYRACLVRTCRQTSYEEEPCRTSLACGTEDGESAGNGESGEVGKGGENAERFENGESGQRGAIASSPHSSTEMPVESNSLTETSGHQSHRSDNYGNYDGGGGGGGGDEDGEGRWK